MLAPAPGYPTGNVWSVSEQGSQVIPRLNGTDVSGQVLDYLADHGGVADPAALFVLEGGANDFPRIANPATIIADLVRLSVTLQTQGAKHILLMNLPDIGKTPRVILAEQYGFLPAGTAATLSAACAALNEALAQAANAYKAPDVTISFADTYGFMNAVAADPAAYGFNNVQLPYLLAGNGTNPAAWLFWDDLHPTTRGHEVFANQVAASLIAAYSPSNGNLSAKGVINALYGLVKTPGK
jgi:outer membrane lipase/esterase